jgi:hypothetical protein
MPLSIVSQVVFGADAVHSRGALRRRSLATPLHEASSVEAAEEATEDSLEAPQFDEDDRSDGFPSSTAGLSILAQALAAYSQN